MIIYFRTFLWKNCAKMKILLIIFLTCLIFDGIIASPIMQSHEPSDTEYKSNNEYKINLNYLGDNIYGLPDKETGKKVHNWRIGDKVHPEELGRYGGGDILYSASTKNGWAFESNRWPGKKIPYVITGSSFREADLAMIQRGINDINNYTCVRFVPRTNERVYVRITSKSAGCYSGVGYVGYSYDTNLQVPGCTSTKGTVLHELTHVLGFVHEHERAERDNYVTINWENVKSDRKSEFRKFPREYLNYFDIPYDYTSVMHYSRHAFNSNGKETIVPKPYSDIELGNGDGFNENDIKKINRMYECDEAIKRKNQKNIRTVATTINPNYTKKTETSTAKPKPKNTRKVGTTIKPNYTKKIETSTAKPKPKNTRRVETTIKPNHRMKSEFSTVQRKPTYGTYCWGYYCQLVDIYLI